LDWVAVQIQDALGEWSTCPGPLYARLAAAIRAAIERGDIPPGTVLPPERALAKRLAIGRSTVVAAYAQLREQNLVDSRQGSGTWVQGAPRHAAGEAPREALRVAALRDATALIDLATAALPAHRRFRELLAGPPDQRTEAMLDTAGYIPAGVPELRQALAGMLTAQELPTTPDQILITTGDQQALSLLCAHALHAGDTAVAEDPTSPGVLDILHDLPVAIRGSQPASSDPTGPVQLIERYQARLAYLMPTLGPHGRVLDAANRARLARALAEHTTTMVIDDTSQAGLTFQPAPPPLAAYAPGGNLVTVGSFTKLHWGGLRLGWIRGPATLIAALTRAKARADLGSPLLDQLLAVRILDHEDEIRAERLEFLRSRLAHAGAVLADTLPDFTWQPPDGGLSLWLRLPVGTATAFTEVATRLGVAVVPGALLSPQRSADDHIRLAYARPPDLFDEGIRRLATAWQHYRKSATITAEYPQTPVLV
jgi:DNA-binding transcriptional MocR family regulator